MGVSRRRLLLLVGALPAAALSARAGALLAQVTTGAALAARPAAAGTSATRCAQCGAADHTMLDAACPLAPRVLA